MLDRIPHSFVDEITVSTLPDASKPDRTDIDNQKGVLAFDLQLAPDAKKTIEHVYRIDWPTNRSVHYHDRAPRLGADKKQRRRSKVNKYGAGANIKF